MIDIHHHLIFGLDDGAKNIETSLAMVEMAQADGITHIVCTPHANSFYSYRPEENVARLAQIKERSGSQITFATGCDFHLSFDNIEDAMQHRNRYTIHQKNYLLVEFPDFGIPVNISQTFYEMLIAGIIPILTHPERNQTLAAQPYRMVEWIRLGCLVQVTAGSLTGTFGRTAQRIGEQLIRDRWVHFLATDAHNTTTRPPHLHEAYDWVKRAHGEECAERLCVTNPRAAFYGEPMPEQPEPVGIFEEHAPKRGLFARLFSREEKA
ncbi:MAG TPA: CpsB/CapC family capsule biosynthesis tyrosine phosphatase [Acidobacteriaceae bacterium]|jgi:protein-tyrosine phosphatase|nr:CpsB/CapC family capsule biosynthesis tyrosine phosphatase [Acidobacteriaceae bacterium]